MRLQEDPAMQHTRTRIAIAAALAIAWTSAAGEAQTSGAKESFTAIAIVNNNLGSGAGTVYIDVTRWSTPAEREKLVTVLRRDGANGLLDELRDSRSTGTIRTPDSLAYDLRFAYQAPTEDGGRRIILATDRPIGFWEAWSRSRTLDYPFTVIQLQIGSDGDGKGTMSIATKILAYGNTIELENFATSPVMLTEVQARRDD
jgi:hypothetical protein